MGCYLAACFGSLMDIDKLIPRAYAGCVGLGFGSLMDIDKLIHLYIYY